MTTSIAPAICCRTAFSGRWRFAIETIVSRRPRASWTIGVQGRQRTVMTGVHGLQHVDRLWTPDLADDDAIRPHAQRVDQELALRHLPLTLDVGAACLEAHHMRLPQL